MQGVFTSFLEGVEFNGIEYFTVPQCCGILNMEQSYFYEFCRNQIINFEKKRSIEDSKKRIYVSRQELIKIEDKILNFEKKTNKFPRSSTKTLQEFIDSCKKQQNRNPTMEKTDFIFRRTISQLNLSRATR